MMKKVLIGIVAFLGAGAIVFGALIAINSVNNNSQDYESYKAAMEVFRDATNDSSANAITRINNLAESIESTGDYAIIEKAAKSYIRDVLVPYYEIAELQNKGIYKTGISSGLIKTQQPDFVDALSEINTMNEKLTQVQNIADSLFLRDAAEKYLDEDELDEKYIKLFNDETKRFYDDVKLRQNYYEFVNTYRPKTDYYSKILNFLVANKNNWHLDGDKISFRTTTLTNQYNAIVNDKNF